MKKLTTSFTFFVEGEPIPKQSFKKSKRGGYTPDHVKAWVDTVGWTARAQLNEITGWAGEIIQGPMKIQLVFYLSTRKVKDGDNLEKAVMDGLKNVIIEDDSVFNIPSMVKNYCHVSDSQNGKAGVSISIEPWLFPWINPWINSKVKQW